MKLVSLENLSKYNELLNQKTVRSADSIKPDSNGNVQLGTICNVNSPNYVLQRTTQKVDAKHNFSKSVMTNKVLILEV